VTSLPESDLSGTISRLFVYPVKSCAGIAVQEALLTETGLDLDRAWMVVDAQGMFLTQRTVPRMALVRPQLKTFELVLRAPWLTEGYFNEPQKGAELWAGGWLHTGDVATLDSMGVIDIRDRIKDVIKTGGEWISSLDLEDLISRHAAVREVAVVGIADPQWGERPFALLVIREGHAIGAKELKEHLKPFVELGHLSKWAIPSQIALVTEIPKTSVGKLDKKRIRVDITEWQANNSTFLSTL